MSGDNDYDKQTAYYNVKKSDEGSVVTSRDTSVAENEVYSSGDTHRKEPNYTDTSISSHH
jgi:hypothetical protein